MSRRALPHENADPVRAMPDGREGATNGFAPLEIELSRALERVRSDRNRKLVATYLGWDGRTPCSLKETGDRFHLTRERVRQIYAEALPLLRRNQSTQALDAALRYVRTRNHEPVMDVEDRLQRAGLTAKRFPLQTLLRAAQVFRRTPGFELQEAGGVLYVGGVSAEARAILDRALKRVVRSGAAQVTDLSGTFPVCASDEINQQLVRGILQTRSDLTWLDDSRDWFWLTSVPRNPLVTRVKKVLCVSPHITLLELGKAISRDSKAVKIPEPILRSFCKGLSWCRIRDDRIEARVHLGAEEVLTGAEATICQILQSNGGVLRLPQLKRLCFEKGITLANLWRILSCSPIIRRFDKETHGLISADARAAEAVITGPAVRRPTPLQKNQAVRVPNEIRPDALEILILTTLARNGPMHCFAIANSVVENSEEVLDVDEHLYPAIQRMVFRGWIKGEWRKTQENRRARYYRVTPAGHGQLENALARSKRAVSTIQRALLPAED